MSARPLGMAPLARLLARRDDDELAALLTSRPDLLRPAPADFTGLAVRVQSDMSLRRCLQHLDAAQLAVLGEVAAAVERDAAPELPADARTARILAELRARGLVFDRAEDEAGSPDDADDAAGAAAGSARPTVAANLLGVLADLPRPRRLPETPLEPPTARSAARASPSLVRNGALAAVTELLSAVEDLLGVLAEAPATTLRTGGVGMRELRRLTVARGAAAKPGDADVGETGWLLELAAAAGLIDLDVDSDRWAASRLARRWLQAPRHRRHQLLVSAWLLAPRSPLLVRGPHPTARPAPALTAERQRGDATTLRMRLLVAAGRLTGEASADSSGSSGSSSDGAAEKPPQLYALRLPDDAEPAADALTGPLLERLAWEAPVPTDRVSGVLPPMVREAERLGLLAAGALSSFGRALLDGLAADAAPDDPGALARGAAALADRLAESLPPLVEQVHLQSDLTAVPLGAPTPELAARLDQLAEKETRGGAPTYRFTAASLQRGLSAGWTAADIRAFLAAHATAEPPSSLTTLIDDAARTWRGVRIGAAASWLLESDPEARQALLDHPDLRRLGLRPLTEEVLVCDASPAELSRALKGVGVAAVDDDAPAAPDGSAAGAAARPAEESAAAWSLVASPWQRTPVRTLAADVDPAAVRRAVADLRSGRTAAAGAAAVTEDSDVVALLRAAVRSGQPVRLHRVDTQGREHPARGVPTALNAGRVRLRTAGGEEAVLLVHRITAATLDDAAGTPETHHRQEAR